MIVMPLSILYGVAVTRTTWLSSMPAYLRVEPLPHSASPENYDASDVVAQRMAQIKVPISSDHELIA